MLSPAFYFVSTLSVLLALCNACASAYLFQTLRSLSPSDIIGDPTTLMPALLAFLGSDIFSVLSYYAICSSVSLAGNNISSNMLSTYVNGGLNLILDTTPADIYSKCYTSVEHFVNGVIRPLLEILSSTALIFSLLIYFLISPSNLPNDFHKYDLIPYISMSIFFFSFAILLLTNRQKKLGRSIHQYQSQLPKEISNIWSSYRTFLLTGTIITKLSKYRDVDRKLRDSIKRVDFTSFAINPVAEISIVIIILVIVVSPAGSQAIKYLPILIPYAVLFQRLMPYFKSITRNLTKLFGFLHTKDGISVCKIKKRECFSLCDSLEIISHPSISFARNASSLQISLSNPQLVLLTGPSGSGKSTLLDGIAMLRYNPDVTFKSGSENIYYGNYQLRRAWRSMFVLLEQSPQLQTRSLLHYFSEIDSDYNVDKAAQKYSLLLQSLGFSLNESTSLLYKDIYESGNNLSGGELRRIALISISLAIRPHQVLLLDEPTSGLDSIAANFTCTFINKLSKSHCTIVSTHDLGLDWSSTSSIEL